MFVIAAAGVVYFGQLLETAAVEQLQSSAARIRDQLDAHLNLHRHAVSTAALGGRRALETGDRPAASRWLSELQRSYPGFLTMLIADRRGMVLAATRRGNSDREPKAGWSSPSVRDCDYFRSAADTRKPFMSGIFRGREFGSDQIVALSAPVLNDSGGFLGIVEGSIDITRIPLTTDSSGFQPLVVAHDRAGEVVYASGPVPPDWPQLRAGLRKIRPGNASLLSSLATPRFAVTMPVGQTGWEVTAALDHGAIGERARRFYLCCVLFVGIGMVGLGKAAAVIARRISRPITSIAEQMRQYEVGREFTAHEPDKGAPAEIVLIQTELNRLGSRLSESYKGLREAIQERDEANRKLESLLESLDRQVAERTAALQESETRYALAARGSNDGVWDWDVRTGTIYYSGRWKASVGMPADAELCDLQCWLSLTHPDDAPRLERELLSQVDAGTDLFEIEYRLRHVDGTWRWMLCRGAVERDGNGRAWRIAGSQSDITRGKLADPLTGLANRLGVLERLQALVDRAREDAANSYAVLFLDLDRFKLVNDSLGHLAGDQLLIDVSQRLAAALRDTSQEGRIGRMGGDEFAVVLESPGGSAPEKVAEAIRERMRTSFHLSSAVIFATASIGVARARPEYRLAEEVLRDADAAMYHAKSRGPGELAIFDEGMRARAIERLELESALRQALDKGEFVLYYQPQVSLQTGVFFGMEALVRWKHPTRGLVMPSEFIGVAEETGLIQPLGRWILEEACRQIAEWIALPGGAGLCVSVNLSGRQLAEQNLPEQIRTILDATGLPGSSLHLEVTESVLADDPASARAILEALAVMGIGLEVDDFGTGYSSLGQLHRLPFRTLKIDRSFVQAIHTQPDGIKLVNSILLLARSLGMQAVAEGIETADDVLQLASLGCEYAQGYFFSPPLDASGMQALIVARRVCGPASPVGIPVPGRELMALGAETGTAGAPAMKSLRDTAYVDDVGADPWEPAPGR